MGKAPLPPSPSPYRSGSLCEEKPEGKRGSFPPRGLIPGGALGPGDEQSTHPSTEGLSDRPPHKGPSPDTEEGPLVSESYSPSCSYCARPWGCPPLASPSSPPAPPPMTEGLTWDRAECQQPTGICAPGAPPSLPKCNLNQCKSILYLKYPVEDRLMDSL